MINLDKLEWLLLECWNLPSNFKNNYRCYFLIHHAGVPRVTEEEKEFADFDLFDDPQRPYSTFNFKYPKKSFERLTKLTEYNTLLYKDLILEKIKQCVKRRQKYYHEIKRPIKLGDIKKLSLNRENSVNLEHYLGSIDEELD